MEAKVRAGSLRSDQNTLVRNELEQQARDTFSRSPEESIGYFEIQEQERRERRVKRHYRHLVLHGLRDRVFETLAGWQLDSLSESTATGDEDDSPASGVATRFFQQAVDETDIRVRIGGENLLSVAFARDLNVQGPAWLIGSRIEVDPIAGELELDVDLKRTSVRCSVGADGEAKVAWVIPF